jgi:AraC-like DNA-binding protein
VSPKTLCNTLVESLKGVPDGIGFKFGKQLNLVAADTLGQLIMSSATLMQALKSVQSYHALLSISLNFDAKMDGADAVVRFDELYHRQLPLSLQWFATEALLACCQHQARWLTGESLGFQRVCLPYTRPPHSELYDDNLTCELVFGAPYHEISFRKDVLELPVLTANEPVRMIKSQQCQAALKRRERRFSINARVNTILSKTYPNFPTLSVVAQQLHTSRSCLYRKLQMNQTSYQCLINEFKKNKSMRLLRETLLTINEIAEKLGFSDASSFRRAFKSWTGVQPSSLREERRRHGAQLFVANEQAIKSM